MKHLDLFSGIGGFALGLQKVGFETVAFCEIDKYCQTLLNEKWKGFKIYNDVKEITKERLKADEVELPEIITGGFPCQPFSVAGKQKGTSDDRHLWPEMFRIIKELKPRWVIGENVKGLINLENGMVFESVCTNLEGEGYEVRAFNIPAAGVGAPHRRERIWIVAHRKESMVNADGVRLEQHNETKKETSWWRTSTTFKPTSNVVNTISNDKGREISRSDEEEGRIQEEHRQENSTSRVISGASSVRQTDHGYEKNVANSKSLRYRRGNSKECGIQERKFQQGEQEGSEIWSEAERCSRQNRKDVANSNTGDVEAGRERQGRICKENTKEGQSNNVTGSSEVMANTNESISRERQIFGNPNDKGRGASETRRESLQPEDRQTRTDNLGSGSEVMANTNSERQQEQCRPKSIQEEGNELECSSSQSGGNFWDIEPDVVEWLMGYPAEYTDLKDWETLSSRKLRKK